MPILRKGNGRKTHNNLLLLRVVFHTIINLVHLETIENLPDQLEEETNERFV